VRIDFITLFPQMVLDAVGYSMLDRAKRDGIVSFHATDPREFTTDKHRTVDEKPFGGGPGMLMKPGPLNRAIQSLEINSATAVVMPDPTGETYTQAHALELSRRERVVFLCGHYEGIDDRIRQLYVTHQVSIGDYVLTGGELPSLVIADSIVRLLPGVLGDPESLSIDSHSDGLLSAPQFTRPEGFEGLGVPEVLRSGDHKAVERWKRQQALKITRANRPDLFCRAKLEKGDLDLLQS
jgi:tRNA (guanine37-N1)-methyltransferase